MTFEIELFMPTALHGGGAHTESLGLCRIITRTVFLTVTEHNGDAHLVSLEEVTELDRTNHRYSTILGRTLYPRQIDLPDKIYVEVLSGHARALSGDQIARLVRSGRETPTTGKLGW